MTRTFTFVSPVAAAWGETVLGVRAARALVAQGHRVVFAAPASVCHLLDGAGFDVRALRPGTSALTRQVPALVSRSRSTALVLVDESTWARRLADLGIDPAFLRNLDVPLLALDIWNVHEPGFAWDRLDLELPPPGSIEVAMRLHPAPFLRPARQRGTYNALPGFTPTSRAQRNHLRSLEGLGAADRLILFPSATWQAPVGRSRHATRLAELLPWLVAALVGRLGRRVRLVHVGPARDHALATSLGRRYRWRGQVSPAAFERLLRGADLLLSLNAGGTTNLSAVALGLPVLTAVNSHQLASAEHARALIGSRPSAFLERWVSRAVPLDRFAVWPIGLFNVMARALARNPYRPLLHLTEVLEEESFVERARTLLYDARARSVAVAAAERYRQRIERLPTAADVIATAV